MQIRNFGPAPGAEISGVVLSPAQGAQTQTAHLLNPGLPPSILQTVVAGPDGASQAQPTAANPTLALQGARLDLTPAQATGFNFDWDDNIFFMPTDIVVYHQQTGEPRGISTHEYALVRETIGKSGEYAEYEQRADSYRYFRDDPTGEQNYFLNDVLAAVKTGDPSWQGPSWKAFVTALSRRDTAAQTTIITARGHSPETMLEGLRALQRLGFIEHLPPVENLYGVTHPELAEELGASVSNPSAAKAIVMQEVLDGVQDMEIRADAREIIDRTGSGVRAMHQWGFSDDDYGNYEAAVTTLCPQVAAGRWPDVKIVVFFTGHNHPTEQPRAEVIMPDGTLRPAMASELGQAARDLLS